MQRVFPQSIQQDQHIVPQTKTALLSPSTVAVGCRSGFTHSLGATTSQTVGTTLSFANPPCVTYVFVAASSFVGRGLQQWEDSFTAAQQQNLCIV